MIVSMSNHPAPESVAGKGGSTMKLMNLAIAAFFGAALAFPLPARADQTKKVIVTMRGGASAGARLKIMQALGGRMLRAISSNGNTDEDFSAMVVEVPAVRLPHVVRGRSSAAARKDVMSLVPDADAAEGVLGAEEDFTAKWIEAMPSFQAAPMPSVATVLGGLPKLNLSSGGGAARLNVAALRPEIPWGIERVHAPAAWDYAEGKGARVAVVDTGIFTEHADLKGKVDGGYDAFSKSELREKYQDQNGHGTHVAGTIAASRDGMGVVGVAPRARLYAVRVLDENGSGSLSSVIDGLVWCANNGIQVANLSLGTSEVSEALHRAVRYAQSRGVVVVAAAGNSGGAVTYPAAYPEAIAVAASDSADKVASFSSRGPEVDFIAPGVDVVSSAMDGGFASFSGTSMAAPHVSGMAALAVSQGWVGLDGPDGVFTQLKKAARKLPRLSEGQQGLGMVDAGKLVR
ncbi:MAG: S8 family peptidase [Elusimicrobia bacterium]|nr:S8 family peptidase [Elusimicrobiota bacterium]